MNAETETITNDPGEQAQSDEQQMVLTDPGAGLATVNEVHLIGRLTASATDRELPSGDVLTTFRIVVDRPKGTKAVGRFDALQCHTWSARVRRSVQGWRIGDVVELRGSIRRRFYRTAGRLQSMTEVEVLSGKVVRRRASG